MRLTFRHGRIVEYACLEGHRNMALDRELLARCERTGDTVFLRFYAWAGPTLSLGYFEPADVVDRAAVERDGVALVRRPTGGRTVLHGDDLTYTVVLPKPEKAGLHETYGFISEVLVEGLSALGARLDIERGKPARSLAGQKPCFASVSRYEVTYLGRKVVGSAQRVGERAVLQHGSIPLGRDYRGVADYMNVPSPDRERLKSEMEDCTACLADVLGRGIRPEEAACALDAAFRQRFDCDFRPLALDDPYLDAVLTRASTGVTPRDKSP